MLWSFFERALSNPSVNVDTAFREMLNLSCSWPGCRPFAYASVAAAASVVPVTLPGHEHSRLAQVKRGSNLDEVARERVMKSKNSSRSASHAGSTRRRSRSSVAIDERNVKMVGGGW